MEDEKLEMMTVGDVALGYSTILQDIVEQLLIKLVEKNLISEIEASEIITKSINNQQENINNIKKDGEVEDKERLLRIYELAIERWSIVNEDASK